MPKISVIIPTHNRSELLKKAVRSVLDQTYNDLEIIIVDDGTKERAESVVKEFNDSRIKYIQHDKSMGGGAARNTGIKNSGGEFVAFLDDDDEWVLEKLEIQMGKFENSPSDIGFSFTAVKNATDSGENVTKVPEGIADYHNLALEWFKGFLTVTLVIKRSVFDDVGYFDEAFPSHQESELMIRVSKKYRGLGINRPLTVVNMKSGYESVGKNFEKRIAGREMLIKKHFDEFKKYPTALADHYFTLGLFYRDNGQDEKAKEAFLKAVKTKFKLRYLVHYVSLLNNRFFYNLLKSSRKSS